MLYLIGTEYKNVSEIRSILNRHVEAYTLLEGTGAWKGVPERAVTIMIVTDDAERVTRVAEEIKAWNDQEAVLVIALPCEVSFI